MSEVLLRARGLTKRFAVRGPYGRKAEFTAVDDVGFDVLPGETFAVVGESGSGKSTTARIVAKLVQPTSGTLEFEGEDVTGATRASLARYRANVQVVFQDPFSSLNPRHTVERILMAPLDYQGIAPRGGRRAYTRELMERVGLNPDHAQRYPAQFSGGQAQRIGIARALAVDPRLVICDEAVSALDVSVQAQVLELLGRLQRESGFSYIFIAHDLAVVRRIAHRVAVMSKGRIVEQGPCRQVFAEPQDAYTRTLLAAIPRIDPEWDRRRRAARDHDTTGATGA
ncbi:peptide/nickel transport system ATP-binding protein [Nonomuraea muscovyensis]|uniref:Peptide/nickel transport system ATP-binding protein n=1 Tax=Nonomuraea muscovyensis TaxID=1124761 RepID=A0A7X0EXE5_9ACTN|nr:ATP-binding cassette domain-containing protein [Nonomuraea muscovyensis]MBB6347987.1 peptide/nickel transport system ATP-binding protein [Nonomuraea muscovyensis]